MTGFSISGGGSAFGKETWVVGGGATADDAETSTDAAGSSNSPAATGPGRTEETFRSGGQGGPSPCPPFACRCGGRRSGALSGGRGARLGRPALVVPRGRGGSSHRGAPPR